MIGDAGVYIVAEVGSNHAGRLQAALQLVDAAAKAGADAVKFQYFRVDRFLIHRPAAEELRRYELPDDWLVHLVRACEVNNVDFLCTAFDVASLQAIDPYVKAHKVGSWEAANFDYVEQVLDKGKDTMVSLGIVRPDALVMPPWNERTIFLVCESVYPAPVEGYLRDANTLLVDPWGVSDHTLDPLTVPCAAVARGARVVEKHVRMPWALGGINERTPDELHSITIDDFKRMADAIRRTEAAIA